MEYSSVFQGCVWVCVCMFFNLLAYQSEHTGSGFWSLLIGWHQSRGSLVIAAGPNLSYGVTCLVFFASLGLELKYNWSLDVISSLTKTRSLWSTDLRLCSWDYLMLIRTLLSPGFKCKEMAVHGRRQANQGAGWGQFESAVCLSFPIPFAKEYSWLLAILLQFYFICIYFNKHDMLMSTLFFSYHPRVFWDSSNQKHSIMLLYHMLDQCVLVFGFRGKKAISDYFLLC